MPRHERGRSVTYTARGSLQWEAGASRRNEFNREYSSDMANASSFGDYLQSLLDAFRDVTEGSVANYIPELAIVDPNLFGISVVTADGRVIEVGDTDEIFTIQSVSKPFVFGLALSDLGREAVQAKIGVEPTGDPFNSAIELDGHSKRPQNPMVNAGAIATAGLIAGEDMPERIRRMMEMFSAYAGRPLDVDTAVYTSERVTGHRNRALAYLMRHFNMIGSNVDEILDLYFQQCSVKVTARDLAMMGATLANGGINPSTGKCALKAECIQDLLSVMYTCGMYDYAGRWAYDVGIPAKSGVGGGICGVVPGAIGIGVFSPALDAQGHSVRGIKVFEQISRDLGLHILAHDNVRTKLREMLAV